MPVEPIGYAAAVLTTLAFLPQAILMYRLHSKQGIALHTLCLLFLGCALWFIYGLKKKAPAIVIANGITLLLILWMLWMSLSYDA